MIMTEKQLTYFNHAISDPLVQQQIQNSGIRSLRENPVCERCEKIAFHHLAGVQCHACGHFSPIVGDKFKDRLIDMR